MREWDPRAIARHEHQLSVGRNDDTVASPTRARHVLEIGERSRRSAIDRDLLQLLTVEEAKRASVGRKERLRCVFGARNWPLHGIVECALEKLLAASAVGRRIHHDSAVGRQGYRPANCYAQRLA